ncbi:hypothetical protein WG936_08035 [Corynebacterium sp. H127]|uniref:hypothetical protein n=1 Tax=Corynebacterium sp. H127 TaxID=3133418 RepID=UPI0030B1A4C2
MIERVKAELAPYGKRFQEAGQDGLARVQRAPYDGDQWNVTRLQRDPFLHGIKRTLPDTIGSFKLLADLYPKNRVVYRSEKLEAELVFRRKGSLSAFAQKKSETPGLFPMPDRVYPATREINYRQIACIWDLPPLAKDHTPTGPVPFVIRIAKPNTTLDQRQWESGFPLIDSDELIPNTTNFDINIDDWDIEDEETGDSN